MMNISYMTVVAKDDIVILSLVIYCIISHDQISHLVVMQWVGPQDLI